MCVYYFKTYNFVMVISEASILSKYPKSADCVSVLFWQTCSCLCLTGSFLYPAVIPSACVFKLWSFWSCLLSKSLQGLWLWSVTLNSLYVC